MGGNAVPNCKRISKDEYLDIRDGFVLPLLKQNYKQAQDIPAYFTKSDFGDMDTLVDCDNSTISLYDFAKDVLNSPFVSKNGDCVSCDIRGFQVDLIKTNSRLFEATKTYFSFNDLGNLMGRVAHKLGFKYGHEGLCVPIRGENDHILGKVEVSIVPEKIFKFLGYDYNRFKQGFNTLENVFEFAATTPYFNADIFSFENLNHINRTRNRKRASYCGFLDWVKDKKVDSFDFSGQEAIFFERAVNEFPESNINDKIKEFNDEITRQNLYKSKFSGALVIELTGIQGKELGSIIKNLENSKGGRANWIDWVIESSVENIKNAIFENILPNPILSKESNLKSVSSTYEKET